MGRRVENHAGKRVGSFEAPGNRGRSKNPKRHGINCVIKDMRVKAVRIEEAQPHNIGTYGDG